MVGCPLKLYTEAGIEVANLRLWEDVFYADEFADAGSVQRNFQSWGVGPQIGLSGDYHLYAFSMGKPSTLFLKKQDPFEVLFFWNETN